MYRFPAHMKGAAMRFNFRCSGDVAKVFPLEGMMLSFHMTTIQHFIRTAHVITVEPNFFYPF